MNKFQTYFGQVVTDDDLNEIFDSFATAIETFIGDFGYAGVAAGGDLIPNSSPNLTVNVTAPLIAYDQSGHRMSFAAPAVVNTVTDENGIATAVLTTGNEKWISIFLEFLETASDPQIDELGQTVFYRRLAGYRFRVVQGSEATAGGAVPTALRPNSILLGDFKLAFGQPAINTTDISNVRQQTVFRKDGLPYSLASKGLQKLVSDLVDILNGLNSDVLDLPFGIPGTPFGIVSGTITNALAQIAGQINGLHAEDTILQAEIDAIQTVNQNQQNQIDAIDVPDVSNFARLNGGNEFHGEQAVNNDDPNTAAFSVYLQPNEPAANSGNKFRLVGNYKYSGGQYVQFYTGSDTARGQFIIATNVRWDIPSQQWVARSTSLPSTAILVFHGKIRICVQNAGSDSGQPDGLQRWSLWRVDNYGALETGRLEIGTSTEAGRINVNGSSGELHVPKIFTSEIEASLLTIGDSVVSPTTVTATAVVGAVVDASIQVASKKFISKTALPTDNTDFLYQTPLRKETQINLFQGVSASGWSLLTDAYNPDTPSGGHSGGSVGDTPWPYPTDYASGSPQYAWKSTGAGNVLLFPALLPANAEIISVRALIYQLTTNSLPAEFFVMLSPTDEQVPNKSTAIFEIPLTTGVVPYNWYWNEFQTGSPAAYVDGSLAYGIRIVSRAANELISRIIVSWKDAGPGHRSSL